MKKLLLLFILFIFGNLSYSAEYKIGDEIVMPAKSKLNVEVNDDLYTNEAKVGNVILAKLIKDWQINNYIVAPSGSYLRGKIIFVKKSDIFFKSGRLTICFDELIRPDESRISLDCKCNIVRLPLSTLIDRGAVTMSTVDFSLSGNQQVNKAINNLKQCDEEFLTEDYDLLIEEGMKLKIQTKATTVISIYGIK